jgi:hypothetical protein
LRSAHSSLKYSGFNVCRRALDVGAPHIYVTLTHWAGAFLGDFGVYCLWSTHISCLCQIFASK